MKWPADGLAWAEAQTKDPGLEELIRRIREQGGGPLKDGRNKFALQEIHSGNGELLVRLVTDLRKGELVQAMVPRDLIKATLECWRQSG